MLFSPGPLVSEARGSAGGTTASRNRFGQYLRQRAIPVNPDSPAQILARQRLNDLSTRFRDILTQAQRNAWNLYASNTVWKNKLGADVHLTGQNHFIRSNTVALQGELDSYDDGPTTFGIPDQEALWAVTASEASQEVSIAYTFDVDVDNLLYAFFTGRPYSPSRQYYGGPWRLLGTIVGDATTPPTSPEAFTSPYPIAAGQKLAVYCRRLDVDGRLTEPFRQTLDVGA